MKTLAMATLFAAAITPAYAQETGYDNAQSFITQYKDGSNQPLIWRLQARRCNPVFYLCVGLEQLNFFQKFVSLRAGRQAVSFARALLCHAYVVSLFHLVSPHVQIQRQMAMRWRWLVSQHLTGIKKKPATTSMTVMATICARASEAAYWRLNSFLLPRLQLLMTRMLCSQVRRAFCGASRE
jgi:hypothetical protein